MNSPFLWKHTSNEIRDTARDLIAIQPVASVEQHGPHLPLGTDSMIVSAFAERLRRRFEEEDFPGLFLPLMPYGKSNEHINYPGTITYSAQTFMSVLMDIGRSCARAGFEKMVFLNGHGGNHEVLDVVCRELRIETSVIMRTHPELVREDKMAQDYPACFDGCDYLDFSGKVSYGWMIQDISRNGAVGDPVGSTPEEGERWLASVTDMLYRAFEEIRSFRRLGE